MGFVSPGNILMAVLERHITDVPNLNEQQKMSTSDFNI
jgi:hypothetical protein